MSQGDLSYVRVLPKDKIYRNIFEAEENLNKSLKKERNIAKPKREPTLPVLKQPKALADGSGFLSHRQRTWVEANPNEPYVENPTYLRSLCLDEHERTALSESFYDAQEVRGLPDAKVEQRNGSSKSRNVVQKINESRKERYETALEEFHQELGVISSELEPRIAEASEILKDGLAANSEELSKVMQLFSNDKDLLKFSLDDLRNLWECIAEISGSRQEYIIDLAKTFETIEEDRYAMVCETFKSFNSIFETIAHLMPPDVHRMMEREAEEINATIICNKKAYADLIATLQKGAVELERKHYHAWETRVKSWKELKTKEAVQEFIDFMNSNEIRQPPGVLRCLEEMREKQNALNTKRLELLNSLREMKPPGSTKASVYQWNNALGHVTDQLEKTNKQYREYVQEAYDKVIQNCNEKMEQTKSQLQNENIIEGEELNTILNESFLPLIGEKKTRYECEMDIFERTIENLTIFQEGLLRSLFKFVQGAAHIWDTHEIGLARQERALQENLEGRRHRHDGANQVKEAHLDIIMDKMRQESSEETLEKLLNQACSLLDEIQEGYKAFHSEQLECVCKYPNKIKNQLDIYDREICGYFAVERNKPQPSKKQSRAATSSPSTSPKQGSVATSPSSSQGRSPREVSPNAETLEEVLKTSNGTTFYVITYPGDYGFPVSSVSARSMKTSMTFLTDTPDMDDYNTLYTEMIIIEEDLFLELRKHLRFQFLESLETWRIEAMERANSVVAAKVEELNSELDLRLHLHKPRHSRAEQDVHNVRAAELVMHQERVESHSKGISTTLNEFKTRFQTMIEEHNDETDKFKKAVQALEATFTSATKTHELLAIQDHVSGQVDGYMTQIRTSLRKFRQDLDGMLSSLRNSNARFRKSFKVFSEGGNFSLDEVEEYRRKLERLANKIDQAEGTIMGELEGMESKRLESALEYAGKLEDRFKHHLFDLTFMEKSSRWITNTQVKIKTEVAKSNSQAKDSVKSLAKIERHIDAVRNPNLDKEQVTCEDILNELRDVFKLFIDRALFLDCLLIDPEPCNTALNDRDLPYITGNTEQAKTKKDGRRSDTKGIKKSVSVDKGTTQSPASTSPKVEPQQSPSSDLRPKTMPSDIDRRATFKNSAQSLTSRIHRSGTGRRPSASRRDFLTKFDRKYLIFGDRTEEEPKPDFLSLILHILRNSLDGLLATAEAYYRQKGPRLATRSTIHDNFDTYAQATVQRLQSYKNQADDYHNSCIQELRSQLKKLQTLVVQIPELVIQSFVRDHYSETEVFVERIKKENNKSAAMLEAERKQHEGKLRPALGHPQNREELEGLQNVEKERSNLRMKILKDYMDELKGHQLERAKVFVKILSRTSAEMLRLFDGLVTVDDVKVGKVEEKPKSTKQILFDRTKPPKNEQDKESEYYSKPGGKWEGLPTNELVLVPPDKLTRTPTLATSKTTAAHQSVIKARNKAYKEYESKFFARVNAINTHGENVSYEEERWQEKWHLSLQRIKNLH